MKHNPQRKIAVEKRALGLAVGVSQALTEKEANRMRTELMGCIRELQDDHNSIALQWENKFVREAVRMDEKERWNEGVERLFAMMQEVIDTKDWALCPKIYEMIAYLSDVRDGRV